MKSYKLYFSRLLTNAMVAFLLSMTSCVPQNKILAPKTETGDEQSYGWRVEITVPPNTEVYQILGVLSGFSTPVALNRPNDLPGRITRGDIVVYVNATAGKAEQLRQALYEGGAAGVILNKLNN